MGMGLFKSKHGQRGMLFNWQRAEPRVFWMKDTWFLSIIRFFLM